jgi:hypothetical protein
MKRLGCYLILILIVSVGCKSSKNATTPAQKEAIEQLVTSSNFTIENDWAYPQVTAAMAQVLNSGILPPDSNAGAINLTGNSNFLTIKGDSITSYLPYFGERQQQVGYAGTDSAIAFEGLMKDFKVEDGKNGRKIMSFQAKSNSENFNVIITVFPSMKSRIILNGSSRFSIQYAGDVSPLQDEEVQS